ncbi:Choline/Carnitine o-acyltransferase-domain-containing protein [Lophiotrema nucula]|uniref:Choline/Carnitine o-acyltransferase-domain-containing protein n=1 Tax=Lophiotrema nucula TaxID=690887 RepID=A0A6A5ZHD1_9PLEO|nr:Choline/Carnitine o-acyltransferase-domain-containing protein [Lophiotrema nucula]
MTLQNAPMQNGHSTPVNGVSLRADRRLAAASTMEEARHIVVHMMNQKLASLVASSSEQVDVHICLADLGLDSLIAIEFKNWLGRALGAMVHTHEILDATGLVNLAILVTKRSMFMPKNLPDTDTDASKHTDDVYSSANGHVETNGATQVARAAPHGIFAVNKLPMYPFFELDALLDSFLESVKALASPTEFERTIRAVEDFKRSDSTSRLLYDRAAAMNADPDVENWEFELQLRHAYLNRRAPLVPYNSFWFSHPISRFLHQQADRAALIAITAFDYKRRLEAGHVKPLVLNEQELTTAYEKWIFNAVRKPCVGSDELERFPGNDYCVVMWRGHAFALNPFVDTRPATHRELLFQFHRILETPLEDRAWVGILTADNRHTWAENRAHLKQVDPRNAETIKTIESAAFIMCLDEAWPATGLDRAKQFHFGGKLDAANRWNDKSLQFVVCSNGTSGVIGEHTMLDALTLSHLNEAIAMAINTHSPSTSNGVAKGACPGIMPLPFITDAGLDDQMTKVRGEYTINTSSAEHAFLTYSSYGSKLLRSQKCPPKSVFQMVVQLAALDLFGYSPACWETVSVAHFHLGRVEIIQVIVPAVASFLAVARDISIPLKERRHMLVEAVRAHASIVSKASRGQYHERNLSALRVLLKEGEDVPALYEDLVYKRARPRKIMSHCFETGMMEKGFLFRDPDAVWVHYEVYDSSAYFSVTTPEAGRASRFCELLNNAAGVVKEILLA